MPDTFTEEGLHVVQHASLSQYASQPYGGGHKSALVMMTLAVMAIGLSLLAGLLLPAALGPILLFMAVLMLTAAALYAFSLYAPGEIIEARFDAHKKTAVLLYRGPVAVTEWRVPFHRIAGARMAISYTERGKKYAVPTLDLENGRSIAMPMATTWDDIEAIREMVTTRRDDFAEAWARKTSEQPEAYARRRR